MVSRGLYFAEPKFTKKNYSALKAIFKRKVSVIATWKDDVKTFVRIDVGNDEVDEMGDDDDDNNDDKRYCFCREDEDCDFVKCSKKKCKIVWYHLDCVNLTEATVPAGNWFF